MHNRYESFQEAGAEVVALAVAPLETVESGVLNALHPPYPLLADPDHQVADSFNVYDVLGDGYAAPSVFVIDTDRTIVWSYVGMGRTDRADAAMILENLP